MKDDKYSKIETRRDKRKFFRLSINLRASVGSAINELHGYTRDIGIGGVCIMVPEEVKANRMYELSIFFTRKDVIDVDAKAVKVQYDEDQKMYRVNMQFENMLQQDRQRLTQKLFDFEVSGKGVVCD